MKSRTGIRIAILATTALLLSAIIAVLACAPAASPNAQPADTPTFVTEYAKENVLTTDANLGQPQEGEPPSQQTPEPTEESTDPAPTPTDWSDAFVWPTTSPDPIIEWNLQWKIANHLDQIEKAEEDGLPRPIEKRHIVVICTSAEALDRVVAYMKANSDARVWEWRPDGRDGGGSAETPMDISLVPAMETIEGVRLIREERPPKQNSRKNQVAGNATTDAEATLKQTGTGTWHAAGITGTGVEVALIDNGFASFQTDVAPQLRQPVRFLCYNSAGAYSHEDFSYCLNPVPTHDHGTNAAKSLLETAPDSTLYITNARERTQIAHAVDWLTKRTTDNHQTNANYDTSSNDAFNVKVISSSLLFVWEGPGDGTFGYPGTFRGMLATVNDAVDHGVLWVSAAGNANHRTWFMRSPDFGTNNMLDFVQRGAEAQKDCNEITLQAETDHFIELRWADTWGQAAIDLTTHIRGPLSRPIADQMIISSDRQQNGQQYQYPWEPLEFTTKQQATQSVPAGTYCIHITRRQGDAAPSWIQVKTELGLLSITTGRGSIGSPGESNNLGMLTIGATTREKLPTVLGTSSRGPAPEPYPPDRIKPDLVVNGELGTRSGTSLATPRAAGMAALVIQFRTQTNADVTPSAIAQYLKDNAVQMDIGDPSNLWGHGLAQLPQPEIPGTLRLSAQGRPGQVTLEWQHALWSGPQFTQKRAYLVKLWQRPSPTGDDMLVATHTLPARLTRFGSLVVGQTYYATVQACVVDDNTGIIPEPPEEQCGSEALSNYLTLHTPMAVPSNLRANPRADTIRLTWDEVEGANRYHVVQDENFEITVTSNTASTVIHGLSPGQTYTFRVRAVGTNRRSDWTQPLAVTTILPSPGKPEISGEGLFGGRVQLSWDAADYADSYDILQWDGTHAPEDSDDSGTWRFLPFREKGKDDKYTIIWVNDTTATIGNLTDGVEYYYRVRAINATDKTRSEKTKVMAGTEPADPPNQQPTPTPPPAKVPPTGLSATINGGNVSLTWTGHTNPNYTTQQVLRRVAGERPIDWTTFSVDLSATSYTDTTAASGTTYIYRAEALKANGKGTPTNPVEIAIP